MIDGGRFDDEILRACERNAQMPFGQHAMGDYLARIIQSAGIDAVPLLKSRYDSTIKKTRRRHAMQVLEGLAGLGDERAHGFIASRLESGMDRGDDSVAGAWIRLNGLAGFDDVVEIIERNANNSYAWADILRWAAASAWSTGGDEAKEHADGVIANSPKLANLEQRRRGQPFSSMPPFEEFLKYVRSYDAPRSQWSYFRRNADEETLKKCAEAAATERNPRVIASFLRMFSHRSKPFPLEITPLLRLARHEVQFVRYWAIQALSHFSDPRIVTLAEECIWLGRDFETAIRLFVSNRAPNEFNRIWRLVQDREQQLDLHEVVLALTNLSDVSRSYKRAEFLRWCYTMSPCVDCRYFALLRLKKVDHIPEEWHEEMRHDASEDIRNEANP